MCTHLHPSSRPRLPEPVERPPVQVPEHGHVLAAAADHRLRKVDDALEVDLAAAAHVNLLVAGAGDARAGL